MAGMHHVCVANVAAMPVYYNATVAHAWLPQLASYSQLVHACFLCWLSSFMLNCGGVRLCKLATYLWNYTLVCVCTSRLCYKFTTFPPPSPILLRSHRAGNVNILVFDDAGSPWSRLLDSGYRP